MTPAKLIHAMASLYAARDDAEVISIGHWQAPGTRHPDLPDFCADIGITVGDIKKMAQSRDNGEATP